MSKTKLFIVPERGSGEGVYQLVAETGEALFSHFCSNSSFAKGDLIDRRPEREKEMEQQFGEYEVMFLEEQDEITEQQLIERNRKLYNEQKEET